MRSADFVNIMPIQNFDLMHSVRKVKIFKHGEEEKTKRAEALMTKIFSEIRDGLVKETKSVLQGKLEHAFRKGINVSIQGLIRQSPSDHLPVEVEFEGLKAASWNLLADAHLYNNLRNVSGTHLIQSRLPDSNGYKDKMPYFFSSFGDFLLQQLDARGNLIVNQDVLNDFVESEEKKLHESFEKQRMTEIEKQNEIKKFLDLKEIIDLFKARDRDPELADSLSFTIRHTVEIIYGIKKGHLRWDERKQIIAENLPLLETLTMKDVLCFQECTKPSEMFDIIRKAAPSDTDFHLLKYRVSQKGQTSEEKTIDSKQKDEADDWCVIIYDANKFKCTAIESFGLSNDTKPCLLARLVSNIDPSKTVIVGSVHLPGGEHSDMDHLLERIKLFSCRKKISKENFYIYNISQSVPEVCVMGDFNHKQSFFSGTLSRKIETKSDGIKLTMPSEGTMAGPDFGNTNEAVDGALTQGLGEVAISTIKHFKPSPPIKLPFEIIDDLTQVP